MPRSDHLLFAKSKTQVVTPSLVVHFCGSTPPKESPGGSCPLVTLKLKLALRVQYWKKAIGLRMPS